MVTLLAAVNPLDSITAASFDPIIESMSAMLGVVIVPMIAILALKKGLRFIMGLIKGA